MVVLDTIIPRKGGNQQIAYLENFIPKTKPVLDKTFRMDDFFLTKRLGTQTDSTRTTEGDIIGQFVSGNNIYIRDDLCKIYRLNYNNGVYDFEKIYDNIDGYSLDTTVKSKALEVPYVSEKEGSAVVNTYTATSPYTLTTTTALFTSDDVNKYVYIAHINNSGSFSAGGGQLKRIVKYNSATSVNVESAFVIAPVAGDKVELYANINNTIIFNDIRKDITAGGQTQTFGLNLFDNGTSTAEVAPRSMIGDDILFFESRLWTVEGKRSVGASYIIQYEIIDSTTVIGNNSTGGRLQTFEDIITIDDYQKFLLIYSINSISLIWAIATTDGTTLYGYSQGLTGITAFNEHCVTKKQGSPYIFSNTKQLGLLEINTVSEGTYNMFFNNQGFYMQDLFNTDILESDNVRMFSDNDTINILISKSGEETTYIHSYNQNYQRWFPKKYNFNINCGFVVLVGDSYYPIGDKICFAAGEDDLGEDIDLRLDIVGPQAEGSSGRLCLLQQIVFLVGGYNDIVNFDIALDLGQDKFKLSYETNTEGIIYTKRENISSSNGVLGQNVIGYNVLGGKNLLQDGITKMAVLGYKIGKGFCGYYKITLTNKNNSNINLGMIEPQYVIGNPYLVPLKNVF